MQIDNYPSNTVVEQKGVLYRQLRNNFSYCANLMVEKLISK